MKKFKFEVGKKYVDRSDYVWEIDKINIDRVVGFKINNPQHRVSWWLNGLYSKVCQNAIDLINEYIEPIKLIFEVGKIYVLRNGSFMKVTCITGVLYGNEFGQDRDHAFSIPRSWYLNGSYNNKTLDGYDIVKEYQEPKPSDKGEPSVSQPHIKGFTAFWKYNNYPFFLSAPVISINDNGTVYVEGYDNQFKPLVMMPTEEAKKIEDKISALKLDFMKRIEELEIDFMERVQYIAPFIKQGE